MIWCGLKIKENCYVLVNHFHGNFHSKTPSCRKIKSVFRDLRRCFNASWGLKRLKKKTFVLFGLHTSSSALLIIKLAIAMRWVFTGNVIPDNAHVCYTLIKKYTMLGILNNIIIHLNICCWFIYVFVNHNYNYIHHSSWFQMHINSTKLRCIQSYQIYNHRLINFKSKTALSF